ncbi:hypothetical protein DNO_1242 [Dichelobacter nodosus VCS1703A]|uniref:Uncharacterized protein n=1 Tax=Dichelobacter nodosus (strain VCS1703A) TaxID=246195 RepID=A5EXB9_DICNV|nr:hypothetical protein DNO_1242 [Dichelobacter nodosus VCS1703A]
MGSLGTARVRNKTLNRFFEMENMRMMSVRQATAAAIAGIDLMVLGSII